MTDEPLVIILAAGETLIRVPPVVAWAMLFLCVAASVHLLIGGKS